MFYRLFNKYDEGDFFCTGEKGLLLHKIDINFVNSSFKINDEVYYLQDYEVWTNNVKHSFYIEKEYDQFVLKTEEGFYCANPKNCGKKYFSNLKSLFNFANKHGYEVLTEGNEKITSLPSVKNGFIYLWPENEEKMKKIKPEQVTLPLLLSFSDDFKHKVEKMMIRGK